MSGYGLQLGLVGFLVLVNALFAGSELALVSLREGQLRRLEGDSARGAALARLARDPNRFLATIQIGITLAGFLASASAAVALAGPLEGPLEPLGGAARPASIIVVTMVLAYVTLVVGELAPKRIAMQRAERWGLLVARPLGAIAVLAQPLIWLLSRSTDVVVRLLGGDPNREREEMTEAELRDLVATQVSFTDQQRMIISGAFEVADRTVQELLQPRPGVFTLDASATCRDALAALAASSYSRAPVGVAGSLDDVIGVVHLRDLLSDDVGKVVRDVVGPPLFVPESASALDTLHEMQTHRAQLALVINEHGGTEGIITVEDIVEELVGDIYDESDRDVLSVRRTGDSLVVPGRFPIHDLVDLEVRAPEGDYTTVAGLMLAHLQTIPDQPGASVVVEGWEYTVEGVTNRAITEVRIRPASDHQPPAPGISGEGG